MLALYNALKKDWKLASYAAGISAAVELPISQYYETKPPTSTVKRMSIAGAIAFASVIIASSLLNKVE